MREVVTLQFGTYANFVGAHFWNIQDELLGLADQMGVEQEIDSNIVYRVGETPQGVATYTPRLVALDMRGSLGSMRAAGSLYDTSGEGSLTSTSTWTGRADVHRAEPIERNEFLRSLDAEAERATASSPHTAEAPSTSNGTENVAANLEASVRYWTDYLKAHLHPKTVYELPGLWHDVTSFDNFGDGLAVMSSEETREALLDRLRFFAEECDHLQGFQCWVESNSGFAGVASEVLQEVRDEYRSAAVLVYGVRPHPPAAPVAVVDAQQVLNRALVLRSFTAASNTYVPLGEADYSALYPHLSLRDTRFHTSAVDAVVIDTSTLPYRLRQDHPHSKDMNHLLRQLAYNEHQNVAAGFACFPAPVLSANAQQMQLCNRLAPLTPGVMPCTSSFSESWVLRGVEIAGEVANRDRVVGVLEAELRRLPRCVRQYAVVNQAMPVPLPFPNLFGPRASEHTAPQRESAPQPAEVESIPVATLLAVTPHLEPWLADIASKFATCSRSNQRELAAWGFGPEEVAEVREHLAEVVKAYSTRCSSDDDMSD
eukprot:jgi/Chlat1/8374/Chrsp80S00638